jgi:hypothetical protein
MTTITVKQRLAPVQRLVGRLRPALRRMIGFGPAEAATRDDLRADSVGHEQWFFAPDGAAGE